MKSPSKLSTNGLTLMIFGGGGVLLGLLVVLASALLPQFDFDPGEFASWFGLAIILLVIGGIWVGISALRLKG